MYNSDLEFVVYMEHQLPLKVSNGKPSRSWFDPLRIRMNGIRNPEKIHLWFGIWGEVAGMCAIFCTQQRPWISLSFYLLQRHKENLSPLRKFLFKSSISQKMQQASKIISQSHWDWKTNWHLITMSIESETQNVLLMETKCTEITME